MLQIRIYHPSPTSLHVPFSCLRYSTSATKEDLTEIRDMLLANKVPAAAHAGATAPCEATVPAQNTGLGPKKTSFS